MARPRWRARRVDRTAPTASPPPARRRRARAARVAFLVFVGLRPSVFSNRGLGDRDSRRISCRRPNLPRPSRGVRRACFRVPSRRGASSCDAPNLSRSSPPPSFSRADRPPRGSRPPLPSAAEPSCDSVRFASCRLAARRWSSSAPPRRLRLAFSKPASSSRIVDDVLLDGLLVRVLLARTPRRGSAPVLLDEVAASLLRVGLPHVDARRRRRLRRAPPAAAGDSLRPHP